MLSQDGAIREAAFAYVDAILARNGGVIRRTELESFTWRGARVPLVARQRGIWKPSWARAALSILTTYAPRPELRPYADDQGPDGYARYKWRGEDPDLFDNRSLRFAMEHQIPILWLIGIAPGVFEANCPVWLVHEEPDQHQFVVALDDMLLREWAPGLADSPFNPVRRYAERLVQARLHQPIFRGQVLRAYDAQCALCQLRQVPLLDAAHIREDSEGGEPVVPNGVAMCAIHHRAFDAQVLGLRPDYRIEIRPDVLQEIDGPTLRHALQGLHGEKILLPKRVEERPNTIWLEERYEWFRAAS